MRQKGTEATESHVGRMPRVPRGAITRRAILEVRMDILRAIMEGAEGPTQIMTKANVSWLQLCEHLVALTDQGFIAEKTVGKKKKYSLTNKGIEVVGAYLNLIREIIFDIVPQSSELATEKTDAGVDPLQLAFGIDGRKGLVVARMINRERHNPNA